MLSMLHANVTNPMNRAIPAWNATPAAMTRYLVQRLSSIGRNMISNNTVPYVPATTRYEFWYTNAAAAGHENSSTLRM